MGRFLVIVDELVAGSTGPGSRAETRTVRRLLKALFWAVATVAFILAVLPHPPKIPGEPPDKFLHALAFVVLAALAATAYPRLSLAKLLIGLSLFGMAIEFFQLIPALNRDAEVADWVVDTAAAALTLWPIHLWRRRRARSAA